MNKTILLILALLLISGTPTHVLAGDFDGSKPLICAAIETFECEPGGKCHKGTAESIDIPQFLKINFKKKIISGTGEDGTVRTTKIENITRIPGKLIIQGVQKGKAWSTVISEVTGKMTLSASDDQLGFVVFCACIPE
jgi:hypothetical protein